MAASGSYITGTPPPTVTLRGKVADFRDGSGVAVVTVNVSGMLLTTVSTDAGGNYEVRGVNSEMESRLDSESASMCDASTSQFVTERR